MVVGVLVGVMLRDGFIMGPCRRQDQQDFLGKGDTQVFGENLNGLVTWCLALKHVKLGSVGETGSWSVGTETAKGSKHICRRSRGWKYS